MAKTDDWGCPALDPLRSGDSRRYHRRPNGETNTMPTGTVKWFNTTKGYGFIAPDDGAPDVFVHISAVERSGLRTLDEGDQIRYEPRPGRDGRQSADNLVLLASGDRPPGRPQAGTTRPASSPGPGTGTVRWFNASKGYGFIAPEDGSGDVFVHASAVERSELGPLQEGRAAGRAHAPSRPTGSARRRQPGRRRLTYTRA